MNKPTKELQQITPLFDNMIDFIDHEINTSSDDFSERSILEKEISDMYYIREFLMKYRYLCLDILVKNNDIKSPLELYVVLDGVLIKNPNLRE